MARRPQSSAGPASLAFLGKVAFYHGIEAALRVTPPIAAGVTEWVWEMIGMLEAFEAREEAA